MTYIPHFSTFPFNIPTNNLIYVETLNGFPEPVGGVIPLEDGIKYILTRSVDIGTNRFLLPARGSVEMASSNAVSNSLIANLTGSTALFTGDPARFQIEGLDIEMTSGGNLFDIESTEVLSGIRMRSSLVFGGSSLGTVIGPLIVLSQMGFIGFDSGLTLIDNGQFIQIGIDLFDNNFIGIGGDIVTIRGEQSFIRISGCIAGTSSGGFFLNIPSADITLNIEDEVSIRVSDNEVNTALGGGFLKAGSVDQAFPEASYKNNSPISSSYRAGGFFMAENAVVTTIALANTYTDIVGAGTVWDSTVSFTFTSSPNELTYIGFPDVTAQVNFDISIMREAAAANIMARIAIFKDSGAGFVEIPGLNMSTTCNNNIRECSFSGMITLETDDIIKAMVKNETNNVNLLIADSHLVVSEFD